MPRPLCLGKDSQGKPWGFPCASSFFCKAFSFLDAQERKCVWTSWQASARTKTALAAAHGKNEYGHGQEVKLPLQPCQRSDILMRRAAAAADDTCTCFNKLSHMLCKRFCLHRIHRLAGLQNFGHSGVGLGDDGKRAAAFECAHDALYLIGAGRAVDTDGVDTKRL